MSHDVSNPQVKIALSIAGSDPSGGAGIQADLKTFSARGVYGAAVVSALTAQNTCGVSVQAVAKTLSRWPAIPVVLDPVMVAKGGAALLKPDAVAALKTLLLPRAALVTPNLPEAAVLLGQSEAAVQEDLGQAAQRLCELGARAVLLKGGHVVASERSDDLLFDGALRRFFTLPAPRIYTTNTHGTGCTLSAAIAAGLAHGQPLAEAVAAAKQYLHAALCAADGLALTNPRPNTSLISHGPVHHFYSWWP
jgi:hydroxymethylpyrimidine/phosphomethylpyrimidine kinase